MKNLLYIFLIFLSLNGVAQVVKYKDVVPMIEGTSDEYAMEVLSAFISKNLDHPAANLKMASLYLKEAQAVDPLIEYEKMQALAEQAKQKLFKATLVINDKEIKKHKDYYLWIAKKSQLTEVTTPVVTQFIQSEQQAIDKIRISIPLIYTNFTQSVDFYDKAVKNFTSISSSYPSLKNLYLLYDDKLDSQFSSLASDYDSALYYFDVYKSMTDTLALKGYNQSIKIDPINVFRYDGLVTQINFLTDEVKVWNYGAWVDSVRSVVNGDIEDLRALLNTNEERQNKAISKLETSSGREEQEIVPVDKSLVFNLLRFDYNNPIVPLLKYKESKQKLLIEDGNSLYFDTANIEIERKLIFYNNMVYQIKESDSIISQFRSRFDAKRMAKYKLFLEEHYNGIDGASQYMASEKNALRKELSIYGQLLQEGVESIKPIDSIGNTVKYKTWRIPLHKELIDTSLMATGVPYTTQIVQAPDGGHYVAGEYKPSKKLRNTKVYLLKLTDQNRIKWFNTYDIEIDSAGADANNKLASITLTNEGVALLVSSTHLTNNIRVNSLIQVLLDGSMKLNKRLDSDLYPRKIIFNEEQNSFLVCYNGSSEELDTSTKNKFELKTINSLGEISWAFNDANAGAFVSLLKTGDGYVVVRNSNTVGKSKVLLTKIDFAGLKLNEEVMDFGNGAEVQQVYKLNDASIHLLGNDAYQMINANFKRIYP